VGGCDSTINLDLTIESIISSVSVNGFELTADQSGATYQWLDCGNGFSVIPGATQQSFTPEQSGEYAVIISTNSCSDTSACTTLSDASVTEMFEIGKVQVYPNPFTQNCKLKLPDMAGVDIQIFDYLGRKVEMLCSMNDMNNEIEINVLGQSGRYILCLTKGDRFIQIQLIKLN
jgi:hypothetical protein